MTAACSSSPFAPISFCVLGSGSAGNCTVMVVRGRSPAQRSVFLLDAGLSPRRVTQALAALGIACDEVSAITLTHLDSDHFHAGWLKVIQRRAAGAFPLRINVHRRHRQAAWRAGLTARETHLFEDELALPGGAIAQPLLLAHDDLGSVGYVIQHASARLGYATDLGSVPQTLLDRFVNLHALCIESNYDPQMQRDSARPEYLKRRIMGGRGHLSNQQALEAAREIDRRSHLGCIALLHLSRQCNCPQRVSRLWQERMPHALDRLTITAQRHPTPLLHVHPVHAAAATAHVELKQPLLFDHPHSVQRAAHRASRP